VWISIVQGESCGMCGDLGVKTTMGHRRLRLRANQEKGRRTLDPLQRSILLACSMSNLGETVYG
jgi:hypothetical protein